jgi:eukaryotic-like serine/threonine-protein kinase
MTSPTELQEAQRIFRRAVDLAAEQRSRFLDDSCAGNVNLRKRINRMLVEFERESDEIDPSLTGPAASATFTGTKRFQVQRQLGRGSFGSVYQVWDRDQDVQIALKLLNNWSADALYRFKQEFRSLVHVQHTNLVRLYELFSEDNRWFFTMELVEGENFLDYVRPDQGCEPNKLRSTLAGVVQGIRALHGTNRLHRDLKPRNILVTTSGRPVILDFGLVRDMNPSQYREILSVVGTPAYMSPEQLANKDLTVASDWYSVGVMLFEALTGQLPYPIPTVKMWFAKRETLRSQPREINPRAPGDLNDLCCRMLEPLPERRPTVDMLASFFGVGPSISSSRPFELEELDLFVGRRDQLRQLSAFLAETKEEGRLNLILIEGRSGIGKSALVLKFLRDALELYPTLLTFRGRCYEFESVPYKGLDALIDELSQYLQSLPESEAETLLPLDAFLLPKLFPVLARIEAIANAPIESAIVPDQQELRQRTFRAFRELFGRLAVGRPLVIWIDDFQWGDRDSAIFLADLCASPQPPSLLILLTYRNEESNSNATLQYLHQLLSKHTAPRDRSQISLEGLKADEGWELLRELLGGQSSERMLAKILTEAGGHPLFLHELARYAISAGDMSSAVSTNELELRGVLQRRVEASPPFCRQILELISIATQPMTLPVVLAAAGSRSMEQSSEALRLLVQQNLARFSGTAGSKKLEPYHDQVRTAVVELMSAEHRRARHRQLAHTLAAGREVEPRVLVSHYLESGDVDAAHQAAMSAAALAEKQLAFDRAAAFYEAAAGMGKIEARDKINLYRKLGDALSKAGRGRDSANAYLKAAEFSSRDEIVEFHRLAADQLMRVGYIDEGLKLLRDLTDSIGILIPRDRALFLPRMALIRLSTRALFLLGAPSSKKATKVEDITRLEVLRTGAIVLNIADPVLAAYFQVLYVQKALKTREPWHMAMAVGLESTIRAATGTRNPTECMQLIARAEELALATKDSNLVGYVYLIRAYLDYLLGLVPQGIEDSHKAIAFLRDQCTGVAWELTASYVLLFWFDCWAGHVAEVRELLPLLLKEGAARGDVNVEVSLRLLSYVHYAYLSADEPDECLVECQRALGRWSAGGFHLQHYGALFIQAETYFYLGNYEEARRVLVASQEKMSGSFILRWEILRIMALFLKGRASLACWLDNKSKALRVEVENNAKGLEHIRSAWSLPMVRVLRAGLYTGEGRRTQAAQALTDAHRDFTKIGLHAYAAAAAHVSGSLRRDAYGDEQMRTANAYMQAEKVVRPDAFTRMLIPGNWD